MIPGLAPRAATRVLSTWVVPLLVALAVALGPIRAARADDEACLAASENEVGLRKAGKLQDAMKQLAICGAPSCPQEVRDECSRRILRLNADMPTIVLGATDGAGNDLSAVTVTVDGAPLVTAINGRAVAIDPGNHTLRFEAPGLPPVDRTVMVREGEKDRHVSAVMGAPAVPAVVAPAVPAALPPQAAPAEPAPKGSTWSTRKTLALVSAGVGLVGVGVGSAFGAVALSDASAVKSDCTTTMCNATEHGQATTAHSGATTAGAVSTASFAIGGAAIAGAVVLWLTAPSGRKAPQTGAASLQVEPLTGPRMGGVLLAGRFP